MGSGGYRPGASQNNPNKISLTGGDGQSGRQAAQYIPDMASSGVTGKEVYESQTKAKMQGDPTASLKTSQVIGLDEPTMFADEPGTAGIDRGPGINSSAFRADLPSSKPSMTATLQKLAVFDDSGEIEMLLQNKMQIG